MYITKEQFPVDIEDQALEQSDGSRQSKLVAEGDCIEYLFEDAKTVSDAMRRGHKVSANGPCLGWRDGDSDYKWLSYGEVIERSQNISCGLVRAGMKRGQDSFLGIYSQNCIEWVLVEHACYSQSAVIVPLYDTLGPTACTFILNHVEAEFLVCDTEKKAKTILEVKEEIPKLSHIIIFQEIGEEVKELAAKKGVSLHRLKEIEELGKQNPDSLIPPSSSDLATVCFTSGTTGTPKGVMLTHGNMVACVSGFIKHLGMNFLGVGDRIISYLPMAHVFDRLSQILFYTVGGSVGFFRGDIKLLAEDIKALKPTVVPAVPRVLYRIYDKVQSEVGSNPFKRFLLETALRAKQAELEKGLIRDNSWWDYLVLKKVRDALGGNLKLLISAGAPIKGDALNFFRCSMGCVVVQAYGQTECTAASNCSSLGDCDVDHVGPPLPCCFVKLEDVPDMGYLEKNGEGEVLVKGPIVTQGYFKDPEKTAEVLGKDGWLHTGDIGRWGKNGVLSIIDRKKNLLKLSQGEYISPEKVEATYTRSPLVDHVFVHGDSFESFLVAVVVPNREELLSWCAEQRIKGEWSEICQNEEVKKHILENLNDLGKKDGLKGFEQVKAIHLHPDVFTIENGILTVTMKFKRIECQRRFKDIISQMYDSMR